MEKNHPSPWSLAVAFYQDPVIGSAFVQVLGFPMYRRRIVPSFLLWLLRLLGSSLATCGRAESDADS